METQAWVELCWLPACRGGHKRQQHLVIGSSSLRDFQPVFFLEGVREGLALAGKRLQAAASGEPLSLLSNVA
jgi:hypothetical protein